MNKTNKGKRRGMGSKLRMLISAEGLQQRLMQNTSDTLQMCIYKITVTSQVDNHFNSTKRGWKLNLKWSYYFTNTMMN